MPPVRFSSAEVLYSFASSRQSLSRRFANALLVVLTLVQVVAVFGYGFFVRHPENLASRPWALELFPQAYESFAQTQIVLALLAMVVFLSAEVKSRWIGAFVAAFGVSAALELAGTTYGLPFGAYEYNTLLGPKIAGRVPWLIPCSWFFMSFASYSLVARRLPGWSGFPLRILLSTALLVTWDLVLDPAMSNLTPFWSWNESVDFLGMPWLNLVGWFATGCTIMLFYEIFRIGRWAFTLPAGWLAFFYGVNLALPLGIVVLAGFWQPVLVTTIVCATLGLVVFLLGTKPSPWATPAQI